MAPVLSTGKAGRNFFEKPLAIFFDSDLQDYFQRYVDYNLAPENRGW